MRGLEERNYGDEIAVVTVTYSPGATLERFLDTLEKATYRDLRVVLVDNGSTDGAPEQAALRVGVELLRTGDNVGYGTAANRGVAMLGAEVGWVVVANPDIEWTPGALDTMLEAAERWDRVGSIGPQIRQPDGDVYPSARRLPTIRSGVGHALFARRWPGNPWTRGYYRQTDDDFVERPSEWLSGSCLLVRREAFEEVGGFDERYFMYFEDVDLGERLGAAGWLNLYVPSAVVTHLQGYATSRECVRMAAAHHESAYRYLSDHHRGPHWKPVLGMIRLGLAMRLRLIARDFG